MDITPLTKSAMLLIGLSGIGLLSACQKATVPSTPQYQTVSTRSFIASPSYQQTQQFSGEVRSTNTTAIGFELSGKINQLHVDIGDNVKRGQLLAKLDTQLLTTEQNEIKANLTENQASLDLANSTLKRSFSLKQKNYISDQKIDELKGQVNRLSATRNQLKAAYSANQLKIEKSNIIAPFDGIISQRHHHMGEVTSTGTPIYTIVQSNSPQAYIGVPVDIAKTLALDDQVNIRIANHNYPASIKGISAALNPVTRTVELRFSLPQDSQVINGEIAYFTHINDLDVAGYWVPISALTDGIRGLWNIYVLTPSSDQYFNVERRDIDILYSNQDQAYIQGPISVKQHYIDQGSHKLVSGQKVNISNQLAEK